MDNEMFWNSQNPETEGVTAGEMLPDQGFDSRAARKRFSLLGFGFALYTAISLVVALIIQVIGLILDSNILENTLFLNIVSPISLYVFALPTLLLAFYLLGVDGEAPRRGRISAWLWPPIFVVCFGLMYLGSFAGQGVMLGFSEIVGYDYSNALETMIDYDSMWITVVFMCIVAPIGEEFVFRKLLIDRTHKYGGLLSILLSGLFFGLMHANFYQFFYAFALGLVLAYIYYRTGNVWFCIGLHAGLNFIGSVVTSYLALGTDQMSKALETLDTQNVDAVLEFLAEYGFILVAEYAFFAFVVASMISAIALPIIFRKRIVLEKDMPAPSRKKAFGTAFLNVGIIVLLAVYAFEFILSLIPPAVG